MPQAPLQLLGLCLAARGVGAHGLGDAAALLQAGVQSQSAMESLLEGRWGFFGAAKQGSASTVRKSNFNCSAYPAWCGEPFNCDVYAPPTLPAASNGHANLHTWCGSPQYYPYMKACMVDKDLKKAAQAQYDWSIDQHNGVDELDGSYCFIEGHCSNRLVNATTTLAEAEAMCDYRYGHEGWADWKVERQTGAISSAFLFGGYTMSPKNGFHDTRITRLFLKMACAMGNYHCDVMYCKETYCKKDYYIKKYKHLLPKRPGHVLRHVDHHL